MIKQKRSAPIKLTLLALGSSLLLAAVCAAGAPASVSTLFGTPENLQLVSQADRVDVCILHRVAPTAKADGSVDWSMERYEETAFTPVPAATAKELRELLLNEKTYDWPAGTGGHRPQYYLRLRFHRGDDLIALDFCFMCHVVHVLHQGREVNHANFAPNSDLFLLSFLKVFPNDEPLKHVAKEAGLPP